MSRPTEYLCPAKLVALIEHASLSLDALRVFHALCYIVDRHPTFQVTSMARPAQRSIDVLSRKLMVCAFPASNNDLRPVGPAMTELKDADLIDHFKFGGGARELSFRFPHHVIETFTTHRTKDQFAMIDTSMLAHLSSPVQVLFYTRVVMHQNAKAPEFHIGGINPETAPWSRMRRRWVGAARKLSTEFGHGYLFCPEVDFASDAVIRMRVKIAHDATTWFPGRLYHRIADKPPVAVHGGTSDALTRQEMRARENWTQVQGPG